MEEKYYLFDILANEKDMTVNMAISLNEASCEHIYKTYLNIFEECSKEAADLFNLAYNKGWYTLEEADQNKIETEHQKLNDELKNCI